VSQDRTDVSVVVPTHRRPRSLKRCLIALTGLDYPRDRFEVVVVDDGGDGTTERVAADFAGRLDLCVIAQPRRGPAAARNSGAARARGEMLAFTDDDCVVEPGWLRAFAEAAETAPGNAIGGRTVNAATGSPYSGASQVVIDAVHAHYGRGGGGPRFFASNNVAFPADPFRSIGGFDTAFRHAEDRELCDRWLHAGYRMTRAPHAVARHLRDLDLAGFWRQHFAYGRGAHRYHRVRSERGSGGLALEPGFYAELVRQTRGAAHPGGPPLPALIVMSQVANLAGFVAEGVSRSAQLRVSAVF
jgi:GT2 family glycosyltransferase